MRKTKGAKPTNPYPIATVAYYQYQVRNTPGTLLKQFFTIPTNGIK